MHPQRSISLVPWDLTAQKLVWNSKNTLLSIANLDTLTKFFFILGTCIRLCKWNDVFEVEECKIDYPNYIIVIGSPLPI